jgi:hypothetical protein
MICQLPKKYETAMPRSLDQRLRKLESGLHAEFEKEKEFGVYFALFLIDAFGHFLGDPNPSDASGAPTARALGYQHEDEWHTDPEFGEKYVRAECTLFAKFGVDLETADGQAIATAAKRIYAALPASHRAIARVMPIHDDVWNCRPLDIKPVGPKSRNSRVFTRDLRRHFERRSVYGAPVDQVHRRERRRPGCASPEETVEKGEGIRRLRQKR